MNINIEEIMKPYLDIKEEIKNEVIAQEQNKQERLEQIVIEKNILNLRLENLRTNKEEEIQNYMRDEFFSKSSLVGYETVRKNLEKSYEDKENEITNQIEKITEEEEKLNNKNYSNLMYEKRLPGIRETLRVKLSKLSLEVQSQIERKQLELKLVDIDIQSFRNNFYSWEAEEKIQNKDLNPYYIKKQELSNEIVKLNDLLQSIQDNSNLVFSDDELKEILKGNVDLSQKNILNAGEISIEDIEEDFDKQEEIDLEEIEEQEEIDPEEIEEQEEIVPEETETDLEEIEEPEIEAQNDVFESMEELLITVCDDILKSADGLKKVKITEDDNGYKITDGNESFTIEDEMIKLPNGTYFDKNDLKKALDNYANTDKGRVLKVEGIENTFAVTNKTISKIKRGLKKCSIFKLLKENKLGEFDIKRVYGKGVSDKFSRFLGEAKTKIAYGTYVNMNDFIYNLQNVMKNNKPKWLKQFSAKLKEKMSKHSEEIVDGEYHQFEDEDIQVKQR